MKRIVVSGGSGYIGRALVQHLLERGDEVTVLTRGDTQAGRPALLHWDPYQLGDWSAALDGADAVVNLTGERAVGVRFTEARKRRIRDSRVLTTQNLVRAIEAAHAKPRVLVSVSGIGYYGDHPPSEPVAESAAPGDDFLAQLCVEWEGAAAEARDYGVRVAMPRMGIVLGPGGGPLATMALPFKLFVGGKLGSGQQGFSWIYVEDAVAALTLCIDQDVAGPLNVCSPEPVSNQQISEQLASALGRPSWLPAPAFGLKLLFGEGAEPILTGQYAVPGVLQARGFRFRAPSLPDAISRSL
jgi:uncharacterized protein (TIGR01777 family)